MSAFEDDYSDKAYHPIYLDRAKRSIGEAFDYAVNGYGYAPDEFMQLFIDSRLAEAFGTGHPRTLGRTSVELVREVLRRTNNEIIDIKHVTRLVGVQNKPYWAGWALAYYQWYTKESFEEIQKYFPVSEIMERYILHEAHISKFVEVAKRMKEKYEDRLNSFTPEME